MPIRYWWLKRIFVFALVLITLLGVIRWRWGVYAENAFNREIERYRALGQPIDLEDFETPPVPDDQNAVVLIRQAFSSLGLSADQTDLIANLNWAPETITQRRNEVLQLLSSTAKARDLLRQARTRPLRYWRPATDRLALKNRLDADWSEIPNLLYIAALQAHADGDDHEAIAVAQDMLAHSHNQRATVTLMFWGTAYQGRHLANLLTRITPSLRVSSAKSSSTSHSPAEREQVQNLIAELLDRSSFRNALLSAIYMDRARYLHVVGTIDWMGHSGGFYGEDIVRRPCVGLDILRSLRRITACAEAVASTTTWPELNKRLPATMMEIWAGAYMQARPITSRIPPDAPFMIQQAFIVNSRNELAGIGLAIRLYKLDHDKWPETLNDLVPQYLPHIPIDLFADDGRPVTYEVNAAGITLSCTKPEDLEKPIGITIDFSKASASRPAQ